MDGHGLAVALSMIAGQGFARRANSITLPRNAAQKSLQPQFENGVRFLFDYSSREDASVNAAGSGDPGHSRSDQEICFHERALLANYWIAGFWTNHYLSRPCKRF